MPTNKKTKKTASGDITLRMDELTSHFQREMEEFKNELTQASRGAVSGPAENSSLDDLLIRFEDFQKSVCSDLEKIKGQILQLQKSVSELKRSTEVQSQRLCKNKLLIYGVVESKGENSRSLIESTLQILNDKLTSKGIIMDKTQINDCYRYGKKRISDTNSDKHRPVLLEFTHTWNRNNVYFNKSAFRGTKVVITELLTGTRYDTYREAKKQYNKNCWTVNGNVFICVDGEKRLIRDIADL